MNMRHLQKEDSSALQAFLQSLPSGETTFIRENPFATSSIDDWLRTEHPLHFVAVEDSGSIIGYVSVTPRSGMSAHVGEITLLVAPAHRSRGIGRALARTAMIAAFQAGGLEKLIVEIVAVQEGTAAMFRSMGFAPEALLIDQLRDESGQRYDLLVLCHHVTSGWADIVTLGLDQALGYD